MSEIKKPKFWFLLTAAFLVALFFRFYKITQVPTSLNWDEAAFGYNAYSILLTGKDEYGIKLPLEFKSVGDYKCPLFVYFTVPAVKLFGLNEFSVRFISSFFGALCIAVFFLVVWELFGDLKLCFFSSLLLAVSPWHLQFTRAQGDVAISSFFVLFGFWQFLRWIKNGRPVSICLAFAAFALTFYAYFAERFFVPVFFLVLCFFFRREILSRKKSFALGAIVGLLTVAPLLSAMISSGQKSKILMTTIFGYRQAETYLEKMKLEDQSPLIFGLFHSPLIEYPLMIADHYLNHFSPYFLFISGVKDDRQRIEGMGMLYWSDTILLAFALWAVVKGIKKRKALFLVLAWLAVSPLPSVITRDPVHARRAFNMVYPLCLLLGMGLVKFLEIVKKSVFWKKAIFSLAFFGFFLWSFSLYLLSYYVFTPLRTAAGPGGWNYGYRELVQFVSSLKSKYEKVIIDTSYQGPYLFFLFYEKYPPARYQPQAVLVKKDEFSLGEGRGYDNYEFRDIYWPADRGKRRTLFAGPPERIPLGDIDPRQSRLIGIVNFPDGTVAFNIVETF